eukprot:CAMPEP_0114484274 /NCGR_PEP_ID=MMETSP0104-20121206/19329_1 /TAXON_ID=37642 ORGANISM="Paraphysomonas imperforata, Strain PA2" /NCGR_SAMPLE_ID=MMETSP0104 /ASSEMBLY_ACC=CAM_ASM_000202 /LENGTH=91 /DNA_ID=CAMNT_0001660317 /DNA_START=42 /DNA_END=314 /DNA_ORIENTATION=+
MLSVLSAAIEDFPSQNRTLALLNKGDEGQFILNQMQLMNASGAHATASFMLPPAAVSNSFLSSENVVNPDSFAVAGRLREALLEDRDELLK